VALAKIMSTWGEKITWNAQREHAAHIVRAAETHKVVATFISSTGSAVHGNVGMVLGDNHPAVEADIRGLDKIGGFIRRGYMSTELHGNVLMGHGDSYPGAGACIRGFDRAGGSIGRVPKGHTHFRVFLHYLVSVFVLKPFLCYVTRLNLNITCTYVHIIMCNERNMYYY
jgi:hypothetical protein